MTREPAVRPSAVAGDFYPSSQEGLAALVDRLFEAAASLGATHAGGVRDARLPLGILVPHAGLVYSGLPAAAAWACLRLPAAEPGPPVSVVILGTNHGARWLDGVGVWPSGAWATPTSDVPVDAELASAVLGLGPPFKTDAAAHLGEHSIEVQLPFLQAVGPTARMLPLAVSCGTGRRAIEAGERLGRLLGSLRAARVPVVLAISTDMAHFPPAAACAAVTEQLLAPIAALDAPGLATMEAAVRDDAVPGLLCGMCGIEPAVVGLAALRAMGATGGEALAASTSADAGGPAFRTVGYLAARFDA